LTLPQLQGKYPNLTKHELQEMQKVAAQRATDSANEQQQTDTNTDDDLDFGMEDTDDEDAEETE
jgi:hypothetical protein